MMSCQSGLIGRSAQTHSAALSPETPALGADSIHSGVALYLGSHSLNRETIKYRFERPLQPAPRSGATGGRRCVVGTHCA